MEQPHAQVAMFNEEEMQMLISGGGEGFNVADARSHVNYAGGYHPDHPVMQNFWKVGGAAECLDHWQYSKRCTCKASPAGMFVGLAPMHCRLWKPLSL